MKVQMLVLQLRSTISIFRPIISLYQWKEARKRRQGFVWVMLVSLMPNRMLVGAIFMYRLFCEQHEEWVELSTKETLMDNKPYCPAGVVSPNNQLVPPLAFTFPVSGWSRVQTAGKDTCFFSVSPWMVVFNLVFGGHIRKLPKNLGRAPPRSYFLTLAIKPQSQFWAVARGKAPPRIRKCQQFLIQKTGYVHFFPPSPVAPNGP